MPYCGAVHPEYGKRPPRAFECTVTPRGKNCKSLTIQTAGFRSAVTCVPPTHVPTDVEKTQNSHVNYHHPSWRARIHNPPPSIGGFFHASSSTLNSGTLSVEKIFSAACAAAKIQPSQAQIWSGVGPRRLAAHSRYFATQNLRRASASSLRCAQ